jgi:hypothetical protein
MAYTENDGPPRPQSMEKMEETRSQIERGIPMETHPDGMEQRGSALPTTARGSLKRTPQECELYMDDILPFADSVEEMLQRLHRLFTR